MSANVTLTKGGLKTKGNLQTHTNIRSHKFPQEKYLAGSSHVHRLTVVAIITALAATVFVAVGPAARVAIQIAHSIPVVLCAKANMKEPVRRRLSAHQ